MPMATVACHEHCAHHPGSLGYGWTPADTTVGPGATTAGAITAPASGAKVNQGKAPCKSLPNLKGKKPGQLLKYKELTVDSSLLTGARMFRVLYTSTGVDKKDVQASCGLVLIPTKP